MQTKILVMDESTEVRTDGNSLLKAVYLGRLRLTRLLLEGGAYINESNEHGETPLMVACKTQHSDSLSVPKHKMIRYLLENGADPNIQDKTGKTALMHACLEQAGEEILSVLLSSGADPTLEDHAGLSSLLYAVNSDSWDVLRILLDACKAKGKEVIFITTSKLPFGHQTTKQYLNVPPLPDLEDRMHYTPSAMSPFEIQLPAPPQGSSSSASPRPSSPFLGLRSPQGLRSGSGPSQPGSPIQHHSPLRVPHVEKHPHLHRLNSEQWSKSSPPHLQQSHPSIMTEELLKMNTEEDLSFRVSGLTFNRRPPAVSRHHSIDIKDSSGLLKALENMPGNDSRNGARKRGLGRKMSYDSAAVSLHSTSHPNLHQDDRLSSALQSPPVDEDSTDCLRQLNVSSLQNVVRWRNIGIDHYSSDSQLQQFSSRENNPKNSCGAGTGLERHKLVQSRSSNASGSRESLESSIRRQGAVAMERRGSGALLLDHIAHTRPGCLPPLNPHTPIPDIGISSSLSFPLGGSSKTLNGIPTGAKPVPFAPFFPKDLKDKKVLWRRHSMQSEQLKQLVDLQDIFNR